MRWRTPNKLKYWAGVHVRRLLPHIFLPDFPQAERHSKTDIVALPTKNLFLLNVKLMRFFVSVSVGKAQNDKFLLISIHNQSLIQNFKFYNTIVLLHRECLIRVENTAAQELKNSIFRLFVGA